MADKSLGKFVIPTGYEPEKVDTAWDELMSALNGKEASLTTEYKRFPPFLFLFMNSLGIQSFY